MFEGSISAAWAPMLAALARYPIGAPLAANAALVIAWLFAERAAGLPNTAPALQRTRDLLDAVAEEPLHGQTASASPCRQRLC